MKTTPAKMTLAKATNIIIENITFDGQIRRGATFMNKLFDIRNPAYIVYGQDSFAKWNITGSITFANYSSYLYHLQECLYEFIKQRLSGGIDYCIQEL